jgi:alkylation response protein AidB-like acyl-CoA dehydrogenase
VSVPESFHKAWKTFNEGEWLAMTEAVEWGGQGMPRTVAMAAADYLNGANFAFMMYAGLTHGAGKLMETIRHPRAEAALPQEHVHRKVDRHHAADRAGGRLGRGRADHRGRQERDGTYSITGNKIFISSGEHDLSENIIHPVLARIEGAPAGTAGDLALHWCPRSG